MYAMVALAGRLKKEAELFLLRGQGQGGSSETSPGAKLGSFLA